MSQSSARWWKSVCERISRPSLRSARRKIQLVANVADVEMLETRAMMSGVSAAMPVHQGNVSFDANPTANTAVHQATQHVNQAVATPVIAPSAPVLTATATSSSQVNLSWTAASRATSYVIDEWTSSGWVKLGTVTSTTHSVNVVGLTAGTSYYFDVGASNAGGTTWAAYQQVTTKAASNHGTFDHPQADVGYSPVSGSLFGANGPKFTDVHQGEVGDCWLMSSFAAVAARYPSDITSMFTSAGTAVENGHTVNLYKVRFFDGNGHAQYVTVDTELPQSGQYYDQVQNGVLWVALAEKAYAQANGKGYVTTQYSHQDSYSALDGGLPSWALQAITGQNQNYFAINPTDMAHAWASGKIICLGSSSAANDNLIVGDSSGTHAYAVVGYNAASATPFELYNPWGVGSTVNSKISFNGGQVYGGAFWANASLISRDFSDQFFSGKANPTTNHTDDVTVGGMVIQGQVDGTHLTSKTEDLTVSLPARSGSMNGFFATSGENLDQFRFEFHSNHAAA